MFITVPGDPLYYFHIIEVDDPKEMKPTKYTRNA